MTAHIIPTAGIADRGNAGVQWSAIPNKVAVSSDKKLENSTQCRIDNPLKPKELADSAIPYTEFPRPKLTVGSLFAGIGGFDLGLERTGGFEIKRQVEIDEYCRRVLEKHWPHVRRYGDIREVTDVERVDVLCGGSPCQDISNAGLRAGIEGERSGLWSEYVRLIRLVRPQYVIVENVSALLESGMGRVIRDLAESGYISEWDCLPACAFGAPHERDRTWIVSYPTEANDQRNLLEAGRVWRSQVKHRGLRRHLGGFTAWDRSLEPQPRMVRVADGLSRAMDDALGAIGNAVVPQIVTWIGQRILEAHHA